MEGERGYFNKNNVNVRPIWIKSYNLTLKRHGRAMANAMFPEVKNWKHSQRIQGLSNNTTIKRRRSNNRSNRNKN